MVIMVREEIELVRLIFKVDQKNISYLQYILQIFIIGFLAVLKLMVMSVSDLWMYMFKENLCVLYLHVYTMHVLSSVINGKILKSL